MTKPDKGTGVVVMDKSHYNTLLKEASVDNKEKFRSVSREQPKPPIVAKGETVGTYRQEYSPERHS